MCVDVCIISVCLLLYTYCIVLHVCHDRSYEKMFLILSPNMPRRLMKTPHCYNIVELTYTVHAMDHLPTIAKRKMYNYNDESIAIQYQEFIQVSNISVLVYLCTNVCTVCTYVQGCMYAYNYVSTYVCIYVCTRVYLCTCVFGCSIYSYVALG